MTSRHQKFHGTKLAQRMELPDSVCSSVKARRSLLHGIRTWASNREECDRMNQELIAFLKAALECSVYVAPLEPGLTYDELIEVGKGAGYVQPDFSQFGRPVR